MVDSLTHLPLFTSCIPDICVEDEIVIRGRTASLTYPKLECKDKSRRCKTGELCVVCGDTASGIHYGVASCNGCKTFFRRVIIENRKYSCKANGNCLVDKKMRCGCRCCRYRKCIKVGMDPTELNMERRRKRKSFQFEKADNSGRTVEDSLIDDLLLKEEKFLLILTSTVTPIHSSLDEAISSACIFDLPAELFSKNQLNTTKQMNFSYWRAKILSVVMEWAKSFPVFSGLQKIDKRALLIHSGFSNMVLSEAYHTPEKYTDRIIYPDSLCVYRNLAANIHKERSGLIPSIVAVINQILGPIRKMKMTSVEYVLLQALILFDPECVTLSDDAVIQIRDFRAALIQSLEKYLVSRCKPEDFAYRFSSILLRISSVQKVAAFKRETLCTVATHNNMAPHSLTLEISKKYGEVSFF